MPSIKGPSIQRPSIDRPNIGISACLYGEQVRFDGGHKRQHELLASLSPLCDFQPVCPEVEAGFGVPRPAMRLMGESASPRVVGTRSGEDLTDRIDTASEAILDRLALHQLDGFILKKDSPSCGLFRVRLYPHAEAAPFRNGRGRFAKALVERCPLLPIEEEGRLQDANLRSHFFERVFARRRLRTLLQKGALKTGDLVRFHSREKLLLLAHDPWAYRKLGLLVAGAAVLPRDELADRYQALFEAALAQATSRGKQINVLHHILGHFRKQLDADERRHLLQVIEQYGRNELPRSVPLTLLEHRGRSRDLDYLLSQTYFRPYPTLVLSRDVA